MKNNIIIKHLKTRLKLVNTEIVATFYQISPKSGLNKVPLFFLFNAYLTLFSAPAFEHV